MPEFSSVTPAAPGDASPRSPQGRGTLVTPTPPVAPLRGAECENPSGAAAPRDASRLFPQGRGSLQAAALQEPQETQSPLAGSELP